MDRSDCGLTEFVGSQAGQLLEHPREMMRIIEPELIRDFGNIFLRFREQFLGAVHYETLDIIGCRLPELFLDQVAEIIGRQAHGRCDGLDGRDAFALGAAAVVPIVHEFAQAADDAVVGHLACHELAVIKQRTVTVSRIILKVLDMWELCVNFAALKQLRR